MFQKNDIFKSTTLRHATLPKILIMTTEKGNYRHLEFFSREILLLFQRGLDSPILDFESFYIY